MQTSELQLIDGKQVPLIDIDIPLDGLYDSARRNGGIQKEIQKRVVESSGIIINRMPNLMVRCIVRTRDDSSFSPQNPELTYSQMYESLINNGVDRLFEERGDFFNPESVLPEYLVFNHDRSEFIPEDELHNHTSFILLYNLDPDGEETFNLEKFPNIKEFYKPFIESIENNTQAEFFRQRINSVIRINWIKENS